ncbi:hypothetical protein MEC_00982 [Bartonella alsatica IBS 382]|uniref:Trimeric autotransporter adhesin YadA-like head domain-containing protein n=1 Tax=Bartonella alsatica IBS 382 TaxID=1094551 RepID=J1IT95_9HYPH|nr:hypothetical protein [Bartonella alsatica]EJF74792.1 hypothetical protein MEC_00982 [Bartonella alsatica IBS 382]
MKKLSATLFQNDVKYLCFPYSFVRREGLAAIVALLTHVAPVWASNLAITGAKVSSQNSPAVAYPKASHGSIVLSGDDDYCGVDHVEGRYGNNNTRTAPKITAEEEYRRFVESTVINGTSPYGFSSGQQVWTGDGLTSKGSGYMGRNSSGGDTNIMPEAYGIYSFATGCGSSAQGNYSVAFGANATAHSGGSQAFGVAALAVGNASIAFGISSEVTGESGIALGGLARVKKERGIAIGTRAVSQGEESIAIGSGSKGGEENNSAIAQGNKTIAIGSHSVAMGDYSLSVGADAVAAVSKSVAIGWGSVSRIAGSIYGYDPVKKAPSENDNIAWKSTVAAFSVGDPNQKITRQITGVAAGTQDTDAVNVAQLKALAQVAGGGWEVSVDGADNTVIDSGDTLNLAAGSKNFSIVSDEKEKKVTFDLAKDIALDSVKLGGEALTGAAGSVTLDATGLVISGGPQITISGINAGHKKISGLEAGTSDTDAVNFLQLKTVEKEVKEQVAASSFVKQDTQTKHISIGKNTDGGTIDIVNHEGQERTLTGIKKGALTEESHDAVTGSQLFATNQKVETVTNDLKKVAENTSQYLGGGANVLQGQKPAYMITDIRPSGDIGQTKTMHNNVGSALSSLD